MNTARWTLAVVLSPAVAYLLAFTVAAVLVATLTRFCPANLLVSGHCTAGWYPVAELIAFAVAVAIGAMVFVLLPFLLAPSHKARVASLALALGVAFTSWFTWQVGWSFVVPYATGVLAGSAATWLLVRRISRAAA